MIISPFFNAGKGGDNPSCKTQSQLKHNSKQKGQQNVTSKSNSKP